MTDLVLTGARVLTPADAVPGAWVAVAGGRIEAVGSGPPPRAADTVALDGRVLAPGFLDLHVHGGDGADFTSGSAAECVRAARFHVAHGTTGLLATTVSAPPGTLAAAAGAIAAAMEEEPALLGLHLEGPWLNPARRGAHDPAHLRAPDEAELRTLVAASRNTLRLVSLAPELPHGLELVAAVARAGAVAALAHTDATHEQAVAAVAAGARHATHAFNGMRPFDHREPGVLGAVLDDPAVSCEAIVDGHHLHAVALRLLWRAKGAAAIALVTDATAAAGLPDGPHRLGDVPVRVAGGRVETEDGRLAGSTLTLDAALRRAVAELGRPLGEVLAAVTTTPARLLGLESRKGRIAPGHDADLVVLDAALRPLATLAAGRWTGGRAPD